MRGKVNEFCLLERRKYDLANALFLRNHHLRFIHETGAITQRHRALCVVVDAEIQGREMR